jgi:hypothetical protein
MNESPDSSSTPSTGRTRNKFYCKFYYPWCHPNNALLFYQLLFLIGDPKRSGVKGDAPYYTDVTDFTNIYGASKFGMAGTYSHKFKPVSLEEMVQFDGIVHHHGVRGGGPGITLC